MRTESAQKKPGKRAEVHVAKENRDGEIVLRATLEGAWSLADGLSDSGTFLAQLDSLRPGERAKRFEFDCEKLGRRDSSLICYVIKCASLCTERGIDFALETLPEDVRKLFELASGRAAAPAGKKSDGRECDEAALFYAVGSWGERQFAGWNRALKFLGETGIAFSRFFRGKARFRWRDCFYFIQNCGVDALPIVTLISFITGMILAYIGAMQLQRFGAIIYVASLIALAMVREMGVIMSGVIMCGRTGSAFAAQIGSMQASEEISALRVLGINPVEYLVLPRIIALTLMLPLLTIYSDVVGMLGGLFVMGTMDVTLDQYWNQIVMTLDMNHVMSGLIKSVFFGFMVAWAGCYRGMTAGKSSLDVGEAATSAAVLGMVLLVIGDGIFAVLFNVLGL